MSQFVGQNQWGQYVNGAKPPEYAKPTPLKISVTMLIFMILAIITIRFVLKNL